MVSASQRQAHGRIRQIPDALSGPLDALVRRRAGERGTQGDDFAVQQAQGGGRI
jgi:hypothetical protein